MPGPRRALTEAERLEWLRLSRSESVGPILFYELLRRCGGAAQALEALPELARRAGRARPPRLCTRGEALRELERLHHLGARLIARGEPDYPAPLAAIPDAPPLLALLGRAELLAIPTLAMVGARNASTNGCKLAEALARDLGAAGWAIVSGLARGIDGAAHRGALESGTLAILAGGIDVCYPAEHRALQDTIGARGALLAELPPGTEPLARHFPRRNRIVAGLARGVIVVEAALRSGSLITARLAAEQGRAVLAVPGSPLDPRCNGSNDLIRQGAVLVETAADVLRECDPAARPAPATPLSEPGEPEPLAALAAENDDAAAARRPPAAAAEPVEPADVTAARRVLGERLSPSPTAIDDLLRDTDLPPSLLATALLELELAGTLERHPGNRVARLADPV